MKLGNLMDNNILAIQDVINNSTKGFVEILKDLAVPNLKDGNTSFYTDVEYVVFDTETKGFSDEIIEIGAIVTKNNQIKAIDGNFYDYEYFMQNNGSNIDQMLKFAYFVKPKVLDIPPMISDLTGITLDKILDGEKPGAVSPDKTLPDFTTALIEFMRFVDGRPIIAHNAVFDMGIFSWSMWNNALEINKAMEDGRTSLEEIKAFFELPVIDTLKDAKNILKINPTINYKNSSMASLFGLESNESMLHRAFYDVIFSARVFYGLYETAYFNAEKFNPVFIEKV